MTNLKSFNYSHVLTILIGIHRYSEFEKEWILNKELYWL